MKSEVLVWDPVNHNWMRPAAMELVIRIRTELLIGSIEDLLKQAVS